MKYKVWWEATFVNKGYTIVDDAETAEEAEKTLWGDFHSDPSSFLEEGEMNEDIEILKVEDVK